MNRLEFKNRIMIGSANFTQKYGADSIKINSIEIKKILNLAKKNKIFKIDTADAYLKDKKIFKNINKKFEFSTKINPNSKWVSLEYCQKILEDHFINLNCNKISTLLLHDSQILFTKNGTKIFKNLELLKNKKYFKKIGLSIYDTDCLNYITSNYNLDVIQSPYNILDERILISGWFDNLKKLGIETHVRSIFLQGLLVNKVIYKKKYFKKWKTKFDEWFTKLDKNNISPVDYCLTHLLDSNFDKIIIGVNNLNSLKQIVNFKKISLNKMLNLKINDIKLIDPRQWKI
jgi:aryl-alcohol dehydrogenase-like predicted oxidoreductase